MDTRNHPITRLLLATAVAAACAPSARAQEGLEEVFVTAQRREESLQDIPIAVSAFDSRQLESINAYALDDLQGYVPSFYTAPFAASVATPAVFIRGMGNVGVQTTKDGAVGIYLDGVAVGRATGLSLDVADLERVEVLRGPQGTLYGRNTTAGAINYITRKPNDELSFRQRLTVGNFNQWASQTDINVPVNDELYFKVGYMITDVDGWVDNQNDTLPKQVDPNKSDNQAATAAVRWQPVEAFTLDYAFDWSDLDYGNGWYETIVVPPTNVGTAYTTNKRLDKAPLAKGMEESNVSTQGNNLTLTWKFNDELTLKSITGYRRLDSDLWQNYLDGVYLPELNFGEFIQMWPLEQDQFSQEFQLIGSTLGGGLEYIVGLYYFDEDATESKISDFGVPGYPFLDGYVIHANAKSEAIYGQATWRPDSLDKRLALTLGLRYTKDERKAKKEFVETDLLDVLGIPVPDGPVSGDVDYGDTSGQFIVEYALTDAINSYLKYATGYRSGGFNADGKPGDFEQGFDPETVQSTELGLKSMLWEQRITVNLAAYYNTYDDLQIDAFEPPSFSRTDNAGAATIKGVELEWAMRPIDELTFDGFYAYMHAKFDKYVLPDGTDVADLHPMPNAPDNQFRLGLTYDFPKTSFGRFTARVDYLWVDETYSNQDLSNLNQSYGLWNARLQLLEVPVPSGELRVALWGKNLADEKYTIITTDFSGGYGAIVGAMFGQPRTYGADIVYEF